MFNAPLLAAVIDIIHYVLICFCYLPSLTLQQHKRWSVFFFFRSRVIWRAIFRAVAEHRAWCCCCCCSSYLSSTNRSCLGLSIFISSVFSPQSSCFFFWAPLRLVSSSQVFPWFHIFFLFFHSLFDLWIIDQSRREVIACTAVNPGSWIGCGSHRLDFDWCRSGGLLHDGSKGKETQTHVREFSGLYILGWWLKQLFRPFNPCASTSTARWFQHTFQRPI